MADLNGGEQPPRMFDCGSLKQWLDSLPSDRRNAAVVIAARAALRVLPLISLGVEDWKLESAPLPAFWANALPVFWANALARVAAKYANHANDRRAADAADAAYAAYDTHIEAYIDVSCAHVAAANAAYAAANGAYAHGAYARAANAHAAFVTATTVYGAAANAAGAAATAASRYSDAASTSAFWRSIAEDVEALEMGRAPSELATDPLWTRGAPRWADERWARLRELLADEHWRPWRDWYQRRLDGVELPEEIELLFATLPVDPREKDPAEQNALLAQEIARLTPPLSAPAIPGQGPGPHVEIDPETGMIVPAKPEALDAEGNNVARLRALHPQVARLARDLAASVSANEQPELHGSASRYAANVDRDLASIDFD